MLTLIAKLPIQEGKMDEALAAFATLIPEVAKEPGTVLYSVNKDKANPNQLVVVEQYKDKEALNIHSSTPHFKAFASAGSSFLAGKPEISLLEEVQSK